MTARLETTVKEVASASHNSASNSRSPMFVICQTDTGRTADDDGMRASAA